MTYKQHPITPPPELVREWQIKIEYCSKRADREATVAKIFQLGADQELEACCEYMQHEDFHGFAKELRAARRPKPPSLKEQALSLLKTVETSDDAANSWDFSVVRRALEQLDD